MITLHCSQCGKEFKRAEGHIIPFQQEFFCQRSCYEKYMQENKNHCSKKRSYHIRKLYLMRTLKAQYDKKLITKKEVNKLYKNGIIDLKRRTNYCVSCGNDLNIKKCYCSKNNLTIQFL